MAAVSTFPPNLSQGSGLSCWLKKLWHFCATKPISEYASTLSVYTVYTPRTIGAFLKSCSRHAAKNNNNKNNNKEEYNIKVSARLRHGTTRPQQKEPPQFAYKDGSVYTASIIYFRTLSAKGFDSPNMLYVYV